MLQRSLDKGLWELENENRLLGRNVFYSYESRIVGVLCRWWQALQRFVIVITREAAADSWSAWYLMWVSEKAVQGWGWASLCPAIWPMELYRRP